MSAELDRLKRIPTQTPVERLAEVLRREDVSQWEKVDAVVAAVDGQREGAGTCTLTGGENGVNTGLHSAIQAVWEEIVEVVPEPPDIRTIRGWYTVAHFWPLETRVARASFSAHAELAVAKYRHRQGILSKLADRSSRPVSMNDVRVWKQHQDGHKMPDPWEVRIKRRLFALLRSQLTGPVTHTEWEQMQEILTEAQAFTAAKIKEAKIKEAGG